MKKIMVYIRVNIYNFPLLFLQYPNLTYIMVIIVYFILTQSVLLCYDGVDGNVATGGWGGELDGRPINPVSSSGTEGNQVVQYRAYQSYQANHSNSEWSNNYQAYNMGLQNTSEGYRYEVSDNQVNNRSSDLPPYERHIDESFYRDSNGREYGWKEGVNYPNRSPSESFYRDSNGREYGWKEGIDYPDCPQSPKSTQIGFMESNGSIDRTPADLISRSEMLAKTKTHWDKDYKEGESMGLRIINKIGRTLDKHIAKGSPEAIKARKRDSERLMKDIRRTRSRVDAHQAKRVNNMMRDTSRTVKVNRFD
jgi:hypothetical protein